MKQLIAYFFKRQSHPSKESKASRNTFNSLDCSKVINSTIGYLHLHILPIQILCSHFNNHLHKSRLLKGRKWTRVCRAGTMYCETPKSLYLCREDTDSLALCDISSPPICASSLATMVYLILASYAALLTYGCLSWSAKSWISLQLLTILDAPSVVLQRIIDSNTS